MHALDSLPKDLIPEILLRLPVDSLLRFRSVCKQWRDLIDTPKFTKSHINQATKSKSATCVVFHNGSSYHLINLSSLRHEVTRDTLQKLDFPYPIENPYSHTRFLGSINGLICTYIGNRGIVVWNPFIRTKWLVPDTGYGLQFQLKFGFWFWGFGYDSVCDEYKVIRIASVPSDGDILMRVMVWIYSFKIGDWRRISDLRYHLVSGQRGIFLKNAVHWIVYHPTKVPHGSSLLIGSLDMRDEEFRLLPRPDFEKDDVFMMNLADLDGSLCMCCMHEDSGAFDLWVMKEYGVKESWSILIRVDSGSRMLVPVALSKYGREFLVDENFLGFLLWCDAETGLIKRKVHGLSPVIGVPNVHIPSLVRLNVANS